MEATDIMHAFFLALLLQGDDSILLSRSLPTTLYSCSVPHPEYEWASQATRGVPVRCTDGYLLYKGAGYRSYECVTNSNITRNGCSSILAQKIVNLPNPNYNEGCIDSYDFNSVNHLQCLSSSTGRRYFADYVCVNNTIGKLSLCVWIVWRTLILFLFFTGSPDIWKSRIDCKKNDTLLPFTIMPLN